MMFEPRVIAHRGASRIAPENTMAAFIKAAALGVNWVEFDVMLCASHEVVIIHDDRLERTTNGRGLVRDAPYAKLSQLDAGTWFSPVYSMERIPTLREALCFFKDTMMGINIELKPQPGMERELVAHVLALTAPYRLQKSMPILFSSFSMETMRYLREGSQDAVLGLLMDELLPDWQEQVQRFSCMSCHVNAEILTSDLAAAILDEGCQLLCYTVNDREKAQYLYSIGVDAIFSDAPDVVSDLTVAL